MRAGVGSLQDLPVIGGRTYARACPSIAYRHSDHIRGHIDELSAQDRPLPEILAEVARLGAQLLMQAALEAEVTEFLGRDRYQRAALTGDARPGLIRTGRREPDVPDR
jgi:hypothetical protein